MEQEKRSLRHDVVMTARASIRMTGVIDVSGFDENNVLLELGEESLAIEGDSLHIEAFDSEKTELLLTGHVTGLFYFKRGPKKAKRFPIGRGT